MPTSQTQIQACVFYLACKSSFRYLFNLRLVIEMINDVLVLKLMCRMLSFLRHSWIWRLQKENIDFSMNYNLNVLQNVTMATASIESNRIKHTIYGLVPCEIISSVEKF